jgi:hypothetical protein
MPQIVTKENWEEVDNLITQLKQEVLKVNQKTSHVIEHEIGTTVYLITDPE